MLASTVCRSDLKHHWFSGRLALCLWWMSSFLWRGAALAQTNADTPAMPSEIASSLAWWTAENLDSNLVVVDSSVNGELTSWRDAYGAFSVFPDQPGPTGRQNAYLVSEKQGATWRRLTYAPDNYTVGPCTIRFKYKANRGASVWVSDGTVVFPEFEFTPDGSARFGYHPYAWTDNTWFSVEPSANGFFDAEVWLDGAHIRSSVALSTVSNSSRPAEATGEVSVYLADLEFRQSYVTRVNDISGHGADLTGDVQDAPFFQKSDHPAGRLHGKSVFWQPDGRPRQLVTTNPALVAALSDQSPFTVMALVRRIWCRYEGNPASILFAKASSGNDFRIGFTPIIGTTQGNHFFAGQPGEPELVSEPRSNAEWNVVVVIGNGSTTELYMMEQTDLRRIAGPSSLVRGSVESVSVGVDRSALREMAIWGEALDLERARQQAAGMVARAGGQVVLDTFKTLDGLSVETRTRSAPYHWRDDSGTAIFGGKSWIVGGAVETVQKSNDVWNSSDFGSTWNQVNQSVPFDRAGGGAAFSLVVNGLTYLYRVDCYAGRQSIYRTLDGHAWELVNGDPPWKSNSGQAVGVLGADIFVMGGQTTSDRDSAVNSVYWSPDGGMTWSQLPDAPWEPRSGFGPLLATWHGKIWVMHGGRFDGSLGGGHAERFDDVWAFDGVKWERVLEHTPWPGTFWSSIFSHGNELFVLGGQDAGGLDRHMLWRTKDGINWKASFPLPWGMAHESGAMSTSRGVLLAPTDWDQTVRLLSVEREL